MIEQLDFDITPVAGVVKGRVLINGGPLNFPFSVCVQVPEAAKKELDVLTCFGFPNDGFFRLLLPAGSAIAQICTDDGVKPDILCGGSSLQSFKFNVVPGETTDVGP